MNNKSDDELDKLLAKYKIDHNMPDGGRCKCIEGAIGHLKLDLKSLIQAEVRKASVVFIKEIETLLEHDPFAESTHEMMEERGWRITRFINKALIKEIEDE